jgi:hypothetical protein
VVVGAAARFAQEIDDEELAGAETGKVNRVVVMWLAWGLGSAAGSTRWLRQAATGRHRPG